LYEAFSQEVGDVNNVVKFNCVRAEKDSGRVSERNGLEYPLDLFINEVRRIGDTKAVVAFTLHSSAKAGMVTLQIAGDMELQGSQDEISSAITSSGKEPPVIWKTIYEESHKILVLLAKMIDVPSPTSLCS